MKQLNYDLYQDGYINRFITTGVFTEKQQFKRATLSGRVNEWLKRGFAIHENPCRKEFINKRAAEIPAYIDISKNKLGDGVSLFSQTNDLKVYFPFGNIGIEESGFYYTPTYLRSYSYCVLDVPEAETASFELYTCGGMTIWLNDRLITDFKPFTRNMVKHTSVLMNLGKGLNKLVICLDDLAERDTDYYFRIRYAGGQKLGIQLPVPDNTDTEEINSLEKVLSNISFKKEAWISEDVILSLPCTAAEKQNLYLTIAPGEFIEKMQHQEVLLRQRQYVLNPGERSALLLSADEIPPSYYYFTLEFRSSNIIISRKIGTQIVCKKLLEFHEADIRVRKKHALELISENDVDNSYKAAAMLALGKDPERAQHYIIEELPGVNARKDCSDFHLIIFLYIYHTFYNILKEDVRKQIEDTLTGYRYWIDEPGDDVMWFFSENHALLFHVCQYLAGAYLPDRIFTNSGKTGREVHVHGRELLTEWFDEFFADFITEWNSNAYIPVDVLGIATLYNLTSQDAELHEKARRALDMICYSIAVNQHKGAVMGSYGRTYEKELKGSYSAGTTSLLYVLYNAGYINRAANGYISVALGDYEPPEEYRKYLCLSGNEEMIFQNTQGFEKHVNLYMYKNKDVLLSTAVGFKAFANGYQEHIAEACIDGTAQAFINHPGEVHPYGSGRPNFWAGNGKLPMAVQYRNLSILKYDIAADNRVDFTHAYVPLAEFSKYKGTEKAIAVQKDGGYIGIKAMNGISMTQSGPCSYREFVSRGRKNVWIMKTGSELNVENLDAFRKNLEEIEISMNDTGDVSVRDHGMEYLLSTSHFYVNGKEIYSYPMDVNGRIAFKGDRHDSV